MRKSRAAGAVVLCVVLIAVMYAFWPSRAAKVPTTRPQSTQDEQQHAEISGSKPLTTEKLSTVLTTIGKGVITGEVFSLDGSRVADADVSLRRMYADTLAHVPRRVEEPAVTAQTDALGHFAVAGLALGTYAVSVRSGEMAGVEAISIDRYRPAGHVIILLRGGAPGLAGTVVGTDDAPVAGARVALVMHDGEDVRLAMRAFWEAETDSAGAFSFADLEPGTWQAYVTAEGYAPLLTDAMNAGDTNVRIVLTQGGSVGGAAVWAEDNSPAVGEVLQAQFDGVERSEPLSATVEASGRFAFERLTPGAYRIAPADASITTADGAVRVDVVEGKPITDLQVRLDHGGIVRGRVFDVETQEGVAGLLVSADARDTSAAISSIHSEPTDESGNYEIKGLSASSYTLYLFSSSGYQVRLQDLQSLEFEITSGGVMDDMDIPVYRGVSVSGVVTDVDGNSAPHVKVTARAPGSWTLPETYTDESGRFEFWDFSEGAAVFLRAEGAGRRSTLEGPLTVPTGGLSGVQLVLDEACDAAIAGTVVDGSRNPVASIVYCTPVNDSDTDSVHARRYERTASDGVFLIAGLPAGDYALGLGPGHTHLLQELVSAMTVHLAPGQVRSDVRLVFDESKIAKISGRVTDSDGNPVPVFATITTRGADGVNGMGNTDKGGYYIVWNVGTGPITVHAEHSHYADQYVEGISPGDTNVDIVLLKPGRISGQVIDAATAQPVAEFDIAESQGPIPRSFRHVRDSDGRFSFTFTSMVTELMAKAPGYASTRHRLHPAVRPGESLEDIVIELVAGVDAPSAPQDFPQGPVLAPVQR